MRRCLTIFALALSAPTMAEAQPTPAGAAAAPDPIRAEAFADKGKKELNAGRFTTALQLFDDALAAFPDPKYFLYKAVAFEGLGRLLDAAAEYERYLSSQAIEEERAKDARDMLRDLDTQLGKLRIVVAGPPGAMISIGGGPWIPVPPGPVRVLPGAYEVQARGAGLPAPVVASGKVATGKTVEVRLDVTPPTPEQLMDALLAEGARLAAAGDHAAVVDKFSAAYDLVQDVRLLPGLAAANVALGRDLEAAGECETYLAAPAREPGREAEVRALLAGIDARLGHLEIVAPDAVGVEVMIGGADWKPLPQGPLRIAPGTFRVAGRAGDRSQAVEGTVAPGATTRIELQLAVREAAATGELTKQTATPSRGGRAPSRWSALAGAVGTISDPGVRGVLGVGYRPHPHIRLGLDAILGAGPGLAPNATVYLTDARLQPFVQLAMPLRWLPSVDGGCGQDCMDGVYGWCVGESVSHVEVAARGALGLRWRTSPRTAIHVSVGYERYPFADGCLFTPTVVTPSLGVEARL